MWICLCKGVTDRRIREVIRAGARTVDDIKRETGAGTDCGDCLAAIRDLLDEEFEETDGSTGNSGRASGAQHK
jgi:bacterioferritin-associated ferredoxin